MASMGAVSLGARTLPVQRSQPARAAFLPAQSPINTVSGSPLASRQGQRQRKQRQLIVAQTSSAGKDFDALLSNLADKFEKSDKKAAVIGYSAAGVLAFFLSEWLIHLPGLNLLLGFPVQLVGLLTLPYFVVKYGLDGDDYIVDLERASDRVIKKLPGFEKTAL